MRTRPPVFNRLMAWLNGEVDAADLEAYQRAGTVVEELQAEAEARRQADAAGGFNPWTVAPAIQAQHLSLWNAFVLQTLGDQLLMADYRLNPATVGYVPARMAEQIRTLYRPVEGWLSRAYQAQHNPDYRLDAPLPAALPRWHALTDTTDSRRRSAARHYLDGLLTAARLLRLHAERAFAPFEQTQAPADGQASLHKLRQLQAHATTRLEYVFQLWSDAPADALYPKLEQSIQHVVASYALFGQLLAMPALIPRLQPAQWPFNWAEPAPATSAAPAPVSPAPQPLTLPGLPALDPWCLTDPDVAARRRADPQALAALQRMWRADPDPRRTLALQQALAQALRDGQIDYALDGKGRRRGHIGQCPWSPLYVTRQPLVLAGDPLRANQVFAYACNADKVQEREIQGFGNRIARL